ncbi:hypothetical protein FNAPI_4508 [Fusarium napiforme]|uniref:Uncharacterized protein n=1 Tax=Fusarium napiforme TaxID=42672 RepID=A0A8H5NBH6_9HYPO|nr:hypothetical protein FNAPI_4508 [Fusarium napiforme]
MTICITKTVKTSASAPQVLDLLQHVHGNKGFDVPGLDDPTNEPAVAPITQYDNPAPDEYKKAPKFQSKAGQSVEPEPTPTSAKVALTAGQNKLAVARVLPWKREFANLQRVSDAEPAVTQTEGHSLASNVDMAVMAHHLDAFRARLLFSSPAHHHRSRLHITSQRKSKPRIIQLHLLPSSSLYLTLLLHPMSTARPHLAMLPMHHRPLLFPPQDPVIRAADLMTLMRDDLVEHCRRPSFKILRSQKTTWSAIKMSTSCKRRMSATAVIMQRPFDNKVARLQALMKDDLVDHCRHPSYMMNDKEIADHIVQIVKDADKQIHVPSPARKRRMSASAVTAAVIMQHPFTEKPLGPALHGLDVGQLTGNRDNQITFNTKDQATGWFHILLSADCQLLPGFHAGTVARLGLGPCAGLVKVRHLRINIDRSEAFIIDNLEFKRNLKIHLSAIASQFRKKSKGFLEAWFVQEEAFDRSWPDILADVTQFTKPCADYLMDTRYAYADLAFRNRGPIDPDDRPDRPNKASTFFISAEHHTVALLASAAKEQEMHDDRASRLLNTPMRAVVWCDEYSTWKPSENDLEKYGIFLTIFHITSR